MKIRVEFTIDVPRAQLEALRELAVAEDNSQAADFVRMDARDYILDYLSSNGVHGVTAAEAWER